MRLFAQLLIGTIAVALAGCRDPGYDVARYQKIQQVIEGSTNKLLNRSLSDVTKLLSLDDAPWDEGYSNEPLTQYRIYHFKGFWLGLYLAVLPPGFSPTNPQNFSFIEADLRRNGVWWVMGFYPSLHVDKLNDRTRRMTNYWAGVHASFRAKAGTFQKRNDITN